MSETLPTKKDAKSSAVLSIDEDGAGGRSSRTTSSFRADAKRPCGCSVLCLRPKSLLCSCPHCIFDMTPIGSADTVDARSASNNRVGHFKSIF